MESTVSTESPKPRCRILPFTPKPQPVATNAMEACYLSYCRQERQEELAGVQRRILVFPSPKEGLQDFSMESLRFRWEQPEE
jgi:hypothetical protein